MRALAVAERSDSTFAPVMRSDPSTTADASAITMHWGRPMRAASSRAAVSIASTASSVRVRLSRVKAIGPYRSLGVAD